MSIIDFRAASAHQFDTKAPNSKFRFMKLKFVTFSGIEINEHSSEKNPVKVILIEFEINQFLKLHVGRV